STGELYKHVTAASEVAISKLGLVMLPEKITLVSDDRQVLSCGFRAGTVVHLAMLISGVPRPDHFWDFCGTSADVSEVHDAYSGVVARLRGGAKCGPAGVELDGREAFVEIDPWEWAGPVTFEARVRYNSYAHQAAILALGTMLPDGRVNELYSIMSYTMFVVRQSLLKFSRVMTDQPIALGEWLHVVATAAAGTTALYINGRVAGNISEGANASKVLRQAFLGRSLSSGNFLDGTIAYVRIWHGMALLPETVELLYRESLEGPS
ncbi:unnamed protein product, partial [Symbiodinium pilosum]